MLTKVILGLSGNHKTKKTKVSVDEHWLLIERFVLAWYRFTFLNTSTVILGLNKEISGQRCELLVSSEEKSKA